MLDPADAAIRGAHVTLIGVDTDVRLSTESNETGVYRLDAVDPGIYDLEATRTGFRMFVAAGIGMQANRSDRRSFWQSDSFAKSPHAGIVSNEPKLRKCRRSPDAQRAKNSHTLDRFQSAFLIA